MRFVAPQNLDEVCPYPIQNEPFRSTLKIGMFLVEGFSLSETGLISEVFRIANQIHARSTKGGELYEVCFLSGDGGEVICSSAIGVWTLACDVENARRLDALFVAYGDGVRVQMQPGEASGTANVSDEYRNVPELVQPGGRRRGTVSPASIEPGPLGAGCERGEASGRDESVRAALMMVRRDLGADAVREIEGHLSALGVSAIASQCWDDMAMTVGEKVRSSVRWLKENCGRPVSMGDAAGAVAMSERNFLRCFKRETGTTPSEFLLQARLEMTLKLLAETGLPIDRIAKRCGWTNGNRLTAIFRKRLDLTPSEYRARIQGARSD